MVAFNGRYSLFRYGRKAHKMIMKLTKWGSLNQLILVPPSATRKNQFIEIDTRSRNCP